MKDFDFTTWTYTQMLQAKSFEQHRMLLQRLQILKLFEVSHHRK